MRKFRVPEACASDGKHSGSACRIERVPGVVYSVLVPNLQGLEAALDGGVGRSPFLPRRRKAFRNRTSNARSPKVSSACAKWWMERWLARCEYEVTCPAYSAARMKARCSWTRSPTWQRT